MPRSSNRKFLHVAAIDMCSNVIYTKVLARNIVLPSDVQREGVETPAPPKVFLEFFQGDLSSSPAIFSRCAHIP